MIKERQPLKTAILVVTLEGSINKASESVPPRPEYFFGIFESFCQTISAP